MDTSDFIKLFDNIEFSYTLPVILLLLVLILVVFINRRTIKSGWRSLKTRHRLNRLGHKQILNIHCPDGLGYHFTLDRLILRHDGITVLVEKKYPGKIYCADDIDDWTQMIGQKSYRFKNPFYELECQIKAVSACVPGVPVDGFLFFDSQAVFPRGHPQRIFQLDDIPEQLVQAKQRDAAPSVMSAWKKLQAMPKGKG